MFFTGATSPGASGRDNEDWSAATSDLLVVLDGATVRTETGCTHGPAWYTRKLGAAIIGAAASRSTPLREVLRDAIGTVCDLHRGSCDLSHPGTPSSAVAIARVEGDALRYAVLGDVSLVVDAGGSVSVISDDRVSRTAADARAEADRHLIGTDEKQAALLDMKRGELAARNVEGGYWIASTNPDAADHALTGEFAADAVSRIGMFSDGAARLVDLFKVHTWSTALDMVERRGPDALLVAVRSSEDADPDGAVYPRNKRHDDATVLFARPRTRRDAGAPLAASGAVSEDERRRLIDQVLERMNRPGVMGAEPLRK